MNARTENGRAARNARKPAATVSAAGGSSDAQWSGARRFGAIQPRCRNQRDPVAGGQGTSSGKWDQEAVRRKWAATEKTAAAANRLRESGETSPRPAASPAKRRTGERDPAARHRPPVQVGWGGR